MYNWIIGLLNYWIIELLNYWIIELFLTIYLLKVLPKPIKIRSMFIFFCGDYQFKFIWIFCNEVRKKIAFFFLVFAVHLWFWRKIWKNFFQNPKFFFQNRCGGVHRIWSKFENYFFSILLQKHKCTHVLLTKTPSEVQKCTYYLRN